MNKCDRGQPFFMIFILGMKKILLYICMAMLMISCAKIRYNQYKRRYQIPAAKYSDDVNKMRSDTLAIKLIE